MAAQLSCGPLAPPTWGCNPCSFVGNQAASDPSCPGFSAFALRLGARVSRIERGSCKTCPRIFTNELEFRRFITLICENL